MCDVACMLMAWKQEEAWLGDAAQILRRQLCDEIQERNWADAIRCQSMQEALRVQVRSRDWKCLRSRYWPFMRA